MASLVYLKLVNHCLVRGVVPELDQVHHHEVRVVAWVSLAGGTAQLAPWSFHVVGTKCSEILWRLFLHHCNALLRFELEELVVKFPNVIVESDVSTDRESRYFMLIYSSYSLVHVYNVVKVLQQPGKEERSQLADEEITILLNTHIHL